VKVLHDAVASGVAVLARGPFTAPFEDVDLAILLTVAGHLQRAVRLNQRVAKLESDRAGLVDALEHSSQGVLLLGGSARILFANGAARAILDEGDALQAAPDGLRAGPHTTTLRRLVTPSRHAPEFESQGFLALKRPPPRRSLLVSVVPLRRPMEWLVSPAARTLVFVADPDRLPKFSAEQLRSLYGLTAAEGEVALAVLQGDGVRGIAKSLGVSLATARTHLHGIFEKTGTSRQAELVRLILNSRLITKIQTDSGAVGDERPGFSLRLNSDISH